MNNNEKIIEEIKRLQLLDNESIFLEIGDINSKEALPRRILEWGKERYNNIVSLAKDKICSNNYLKKLSINENSKNNVEIILIVCEIIRSIEPSVPYISIAVLLCRNGINNLCEKKWINEE